MSNVKPIRTYRFVVPGLPPKKGTERSMWAKPVEVPRVIELRLAAHAALAGAAPLTRGIRLLFVLLLPRDSQVAGDLDNFVSGICDGLQRANTASPIGLGARWHDPRLRDIHPIRFAVIEDDREIVFIQAERRVVDAEAPSYEIEVSGE